MYVLTKNEKAAP